MGTKKVILQTKRHFSEDFRRALVKEYETGKFSIPELSRLHQIQHTVLYRWVNKYSAYNRSKFIVVEMKESSTKKLKDLETRIKELERIVGQKQIMIDYLEKMIELASDQYDIDIKKNFDTPQSSGSGITGPKLTSR
jgi:transposase